MYVLSVITAVAAFVLAAVWAVVGLAGLVGKLPGNRWVGVRTRETIRSQDAWTLAHRVAAPGFLAGAAALTLGGLLALFNSWGFLYALGGLVLGLLAVSVLSGIAVRAAQTVPAPEGEGGCSSDCCSGGGTDAAPTGCSDNRPDDGSGDPAADCGESSCGSCSLRGMCLPESQAGSGAVH